jgi:iron-sulfur cluster assembly protein
MSRELPAPFTMTERAFAYLQAALAKTPEKKGVRIDVKTAGCSGLKYQFALAEVAGPGDRTVTVKGIPMFIAALAEMHLLGAQLDYVTSGMNSELDFVANPNEAARCGCGESFTPVKKA